MSSDESAVYKRMQVKVLYSFNNNPTVFLSRSKVQHSVKIAQIPMYSSTELLEEEMITLGAFDLKHCTQQVLKNSPENFRLETEDYAVYYKDITEQPDEPFVSNGVLSNLISSSKSHLIPGRVCQNLSASYLFGDKSSSSSLTLEIRLKLHTIEKQEANHQHVQSQMNSKRANDNMSYAQKRPRTKPMASSNAAMKATRTKSLPIFYHPPNQQIFNIMNADKSNAPSKYDSKSVQERFKLAPFLQAKIIDNPTRKSRSHHSNNQHNQHAIKESTPEPQRAMRTRSMVTSRMPLSVSLPIQEDILSDATDDTDYNDNHPPIDEDDEEEEDDDDDDDGAFEDNDTSPYTPQQPPYKAIPISTNTTSNSQFHALPDLEDLDSRKTHTIPHNKLPKNHGLICTNSNCATDSSITWRYFETGFHPNYLGIHRATEFDKKHYEGMFGPLCNACYLFLRNKGFMRPEGVVKKYLQQQKYKKELKQKEEDDKINEMSNSYPHNYKARLNSLTSVAMRNSNQFGSSPVVAQSHKFPTPLHTPSAINQVIQNNNHNNSNNNNSNNRLTPNYNDLNDFMNQLNSFGGPLTDIDPLPQDQQQGITPPMMATKSNTRVINLYDDGEDKENCPPMTSDDQKRSSSSSPNKNNYQEIENMMVKSFNQNTNTSPNGAQTEWINNLFGEPTPRDQTPKDGTTGENETGKLSAKYGTPNELKHSRGTNNDDTESEKEENNQCHPHLPQLRTFTTHNRSSPNNSKSMQSLAANMPSSPLIISNQENHHEDIDTFLTSDTHHKQNNFSELESEMNTLVNDNNMFHDKENNHSSPSIAKASRNNTTMSWGPNQKSNSLANIEGGSTPNTDFYSNDDSSNTQEKKYLHSVDINTVFNEQLNH